MMNSEELGIYGHQNAQIRVTLWDCPGAFPVSRQVRIQLNLMEIHDTIRIPLLPGFVFTVLQSRVAVFAKPAPASIFSRPFSRFGDH